MKITAVRLHRLESRGSGGVERCAVELQTDSELTGFAQSDACVAYEISHLTRSVLVGEDPRATTLLWQRMAAAATNGPAAAAALDIALWDLKAKIQNQPLWQALGASRPRVNVHARLSSPSQAAIIGNHGFRGALISAAHVGHLAAIRGALAEQSSDPALLIHADESWSPKDTIRAIRALEEGFDLTWVEAASRQWDFLGLKRVSAAIRAAVCAGRYFGVSDFLAPLHHHAIDIVQIALERTGITGALRIADAAYGFELPVTFCASPGNLGVHVGAALPNCMSVEIVDVDAGDVRIEQGWAIGGETPGNGLGVGADA